MTLNEEDEATADDRRRRYVGHATGWSAIEGQGMGSGPRTTTDNKQLPRHHKHPSLSVVEDGDQSDISGSGMLSECTEDF
jgi:hypothetical protein